jgi:hypothetical protein
LNVGGHISEIQIAVSLFEGNFSHVLNHSKLIVVNGHCQRLLRKNL